LPRGRVGLLANPTAVDRQLRHAADSLAAHPDVDLRLLLGPEHGIRGDAQDMVSVGEGLDSRTGLRAVSLYGHTFASLTPSPADLQEIDVLVYDIQDVGARYYTYAATLALCMRTGIPTVVLDRPNPIGGVQREGGVLEPGLENFCGLFPIPQRHGMTVGELAHLYVDSFGVRCPLTVVQCQGWRRGEYFDQTGLPWVMPSPNMPTLDSALVYPGTCLLEATNVSEGRGTTRPFELFGAPWIDSARLCAELGRESGVALRPCSFRPMFHKHQGALCHGAQIYVTDRGAFRPFRFGIVLLHALLRLFPDFAWRREAYEFRDDVPAIDLLTGTPAVRSALDAGDLAMALAAAEPRDAFKFRSLYPD
jgi:uncharacterized protein YbbC (DUF1343 family)